LTVFVFVFVFAFSLGAFLPFAVSWSSRGVDRGQCSDDDHTDIRGFSHENDPSGAASFYFA
jgi:hypothetical protein